MKETKIAKDKPLSEKAFTIVNWDKKVNWTEDVAEAVKKLKEELCLGCKGKGCSNCERIDKIMGNFNHRHSEGTVNGTVKEDVHVKKDKGCVTLGTSNCDCVICRRIRALSPKCEVGLKEDKQ